VKRLKKTIPAAIIALLIAAVLAPGVSQAATAPYFVALNDTLLPFSDDTSPIVSGGELFIHDRVLEGLGVFAIGSDDLGFVRLYRGTRYVDFYVARGTTQDQNGNTLFWPAPRRVGGKLYVPLRHVTEYMGLTYQVIDIPLDIIPDQQTQLVRIVSEALFNGQTLVGMNRNAIKAAYNDYFSPAQPPSPPIGEPAEPTPTPEPAPTYEDVTIHLSFFDISAGSAEAILDLLDIQAERGFHSCFFVSRRDIAENPGIIRRISGSGHTIGLWLEEGTYMEYLEASGVLFEAAKAKTVIVSAGGAAEATAAMAGGYGLIFWETAQSLVDYENQTLKAITEEIPRESGARRNLLFSCSENAASALPEVYSFLVANEFSVMRISETVEPVMQLRVEMPEAAVRSMGN